MALIAGPAVLGGCVTPEAAPRTVLDQRTGASLTVVDEPLVLARERRDIAVQARDYLTLVAAEFNEAGRRRLLLVVHQWSTIDSRASDVAPQGQLALLLVADGRDLRMTPVHDLDTSLLGRIPALLPPEDAHVTTTFYEVDAALLEYVATSRKLAASYPDSFALPFAVWRDGRPAISRLVSLVGKK
jgi:hypothetical protein